MKLSKAHQQQVANDFMVFINANVQAVKAHAQCVSSTSLLFTLYCKSCSWELKQDIYKYCNDDNINTFLNSWYKKNVSLFTLEG